MRVMTRGVRAVAETLFAREDGLPPAERIDWVCSDFEDFLDHAGPRAEAVLGASLAVATWVAPLSIGRRPPLGRLSIEDRCRALHKTEGTFIGMSILALKAMLCFSYFEHPDSLEEIGADTECLGGRS